MDEEVEDLVGEVKLSNSQKSVATSNLYSPDFTDSSSEKCNSSGKDTYVIDVDETEDSDPFQPTTSSTINLKELTGTMVKLDHSKKSLNKAKSMPIHRYSIISQEIFTQTSKTIIELAEHESGIKKIAAQSTLETQTSFMSISENKTVEYTVEITGAEPQYSKHGVVDRTNPSKCISVTYNDALNNTLEDESSVDVGSMSENERTIAAKSNTSSDEFIPFIEDEVDASESTKQFILERKTEIDDSSVFDSDFEEDSLMKENGKHNDDNNSENSEITKSVDNDVEDLYSKLSNCFDFYVPEKRDDNEFKRLGVLTPLTEESTVRKDSILDLTPVIQVSTEKNVDMAKNVLFCSNSGLKIKMLPDDGEAKTKEVLKLPPIQFNSHPSTPKSNFVIKNDGSIKQSKTETLNSLFGCQRDAGMDRWEMNSRNFASGEGNVINVCYESERRHGDTILPPILLDANKYSARTNSYPLSVSSKFDCDASESTKDSISIKESIQELKNSNKNPSVDTKSSVQQSQSRSGSPRSNISYYGHSFVEVAEKSCEGLSSDLLKRLHSSSWFEVYETLEDLPRQLDKFWGVISETRIADLIRQVLVHVESPRTQLAKSACNAVAAILKNTNYTKKPDFYEAMTLLLIKTGSYSRPVRRAANVALDDIVSGVDLTQAITALCIHGVSHKNPVVRCSAARLLVVGAALGGAGRALLRRRPPSAAAARRLAFRALATLLDDRNTPARKYAERFYQMLRPLPNFEAYFLHDVNVETASRHMKKYDQLQAVRTAVAKETR